MDREHSGGQLASRRCPPEQGRDSLSFLEQIDDLMMTSIHQLSPRDQEMLATHYRLDLEPETVLPPSPSTRQDQAALRQVRLRFNRILEAEIEKAVIPENLRQTALRFVRGGDLRPDVILKD